MTLPPASIDLEGLGFDEGAHVLVKLALSAQPTGGTIVVRGTHHDLLGGLATWCRQQGHRWHAIDDASDTMAAVVERGAFVNARWVGAERAGRADVVGAQASPSWGLAARGAVIEAGGPPASFALDSGDELWTERAASLYAQAAAAQWDPATAIDWATPITHDDYVEDAVVQLMTYLIENEEAALVVPARFLGQVHPHFREIQQVLAVTVADEARHIEVFTRRAGLTPRKLALSSAGGRASLQTLLDEPDYATAAFLLSVMGEGTFVSLLGFLEKHGPDPLTRRIAHMTRQDEARHVAFAMSHLERHAEIDRGLNARLARAVERRHDNLRGTAGLNDEVFDALVLLAAGAATPAAIATGWAAVQELQRDMHESRRTRLARLHFTAAESDALSALHTRNFM